MRPLECPDWSQKLVYILPCVSLHLAGLDLFPYNDNYKLEIEVQNVSEFYELV